LCTPRTPLRSLRLKKIINSTNRAPTNPSKSKQSEAIKISVNLLNPSNPCPIKKKRSVLCDLSELLCVLCGSKKTIINSTNRAPKNPSKSKQSEAIKISVNLLNYSNPCPIKKKRSVPCSLKG